MDCEKCGTRMAKHSRRGDAQQYRCRECNHFQTAPAALGHEDVPARASPETAGLHDDGNRATCVGPVGDSPPTLDSLLDSFQVDVDVWAVERWVVNRWDVTAKVAGRLVKSPNYQAKAWLTRKIPVKCEWPAIQGAFVAAPPKMPAVILDGGLRRAVILADAQAGFRRDTNTGELEPTHDPAACSVALEIIRDIEPDLLVYLGDMIDLPELGKYRITPDLIMTTQPSIDWLGGWLAETARHAGRRVYLEGNHEIRLRNALVDNLRAAYGIRPANEPDTPPAISIPYLLGLVVLGI